MPAAAEGVTLAVNEMLVPTVADELDGEMLVLVEVALDVPPELLPHPEPNIDASARYPKIKALGTEQSFIVTPS